MDKIYHKCYYHDIQGRLKRANHKNRFDSAYALRVNFIATVFYRTFLLETRMLKKNKRFLFIIIHILFICLYVDFVIFDNGDYFVTVSDIF